MSIIFLGMPCIAISENKHTYNYNCAHMSYSYSFQEKPGCLVQQSGRCLTPADLQNRASSATMLEPSARLPRGLTSHYGSNERGLPASREGLRVPTEPWVTGDTPEPGRVHIRIFVSGAEMKADRNGSSLMNSERLTSTKSLCPPNDTTDGELPYARWEIEQNMPQLSLHYAGSWQMVQPAIAALVLANGGRVVQQWAAGSSGRQRLQAALTFGHFVGAPGSSPH